MAHYREIKKLQWMKKPLDERKKKSHTTLLGQKKVICIYWIP